MRDGIMVSLDGRVRRLSPSQASPAQTKSRHYAWENVLMHYYCHDLLTSCWTYPKKVRFTATVLRRCPWPAMEGVCGCERGAQYMIDVYLICKLSCTVSRQQQERVSDASLHPQLPLGNCG